MASVFGHAFFGIGLSKAFSRKTSFKILVFAAICTIIPDADVLAFKFGIPYESPWGHRGFSHSILFASIFSFIVKQLFFRRIRLFSLEGGSLWFLFFLCVLSHSILDSLTNGGLGVGYFIPFENSRYFSPWRPVQVSPIGVRNFFSEWGLRVILSEALWIGIPGLLLFILGSARRKKKTTKVPSV